MYLTLVGLIYVSKPYRPCPLFVRFMKCISLFAIPILSVEHGQNNG